MKGIPRMIVGGPDCPGCHHGHTKFDLRPSGWICEKHGPCAENQVVIMEGNVHCLACLREALGGATLPTLERRKLEPEEFDGYNLSDGRFIKHRESVKQPLSTEDEPDGGGRRIMGK